MRAGSGIQAPGCGAAAAGLGRNLAAGKDRGAAIRRAISDAQRGDIVLIAGKGHETYQEVKGVKRPFSDLAMARAALREAAA